MVFVKTSTGLVGMAVHPNPHHTLESLYGKIQRVLSKMPKNAAYRHFTEKIIKERSDILKETNDTFQIEVKMNAGQAEELIIQAENELHLARQMLNWKPWEPLIAKPPAGQWEWPPFKGV